MLLENAFSCKVNVDSLIHRYVNKDICMHMMQSRFFFLEE